MPQIRAVLFDYGLVLSGPPDPIAWQRMEAILDATQPELRAAYWRHRNNYDLGVLNGVGFWSVVGAELGHPPADDELTQLLEADVDLWTQPNQPMIDWAAALQSSDTSTGILSNMGDAMETGIIARFPWIAGFPHRTFSHRLGIAKPDERIYRHAIAGTGEPAAGDALHRRSRGEYRGRPHRRPSRDPVQQPWGLPARVSRRRLHRPAAAGGRVVGPEICSAVVLTVSVQWLSG